MLVFLACRLLEFLWYMCPPQFCGYTFCLLHTVFSDFSIDIGIRLSLHLSKELSLINFPFQYFSRSVFKNISSLFCLFLFTFFILVFLVFQDRIVVEYSFKLGYVCLCCGTCILMLQRSVAFFYVVFI